MKQQENEGISMAIGSERGNDTGAAPGTVEVTARIMGESGEWIERSVRINSGVSIGTFDVSSRNGFLASFDTLEQSMIYARDLATREATEEFLREVGKKRTL